MRKIKKLVATLLAATMMMAMGVTAFAADGATLANGSYTANQNLYKNAACTKTSMGDAAVNDMWADITINANGKATLVVHTHEIKYLGLTGHLGKMEINGTAKEPVKDSSGDVVDYYFTFTDLDASMFYEGCVITGKFTTYVGIMPMSATGYLKLTGIE